MIIDRIKQWFKRETFTTSNYRRGMLPLLSSSSSGITVSDSTALTISTVWACVRAIADPIGFLPLHVYRRTKTGRQKAQNHEAYYLLHDAPTPYITACHFRAAIMAHVLLRGNGFARIRRAAGTGRLIALEPLLPDRVGMRIDNGDVLYEISGSGGTETVSASEILHIRGLSPDGLWGYSVVTMAREALGLAAAMERYGASFFGNGARPPYVLEHPGGFRTEEEYKQFRARWQEAYGNADMWHQAIVITGGMKYTPIGISPEDAQFLTSRQFQVQEICRWFRVSPHLVADLSRATFSNIEHLGIEFLTQTLSYWLKVWEQEINLKLLGPSFYAEFDTNALVRGDFESRMRGYATQLQNGIISINEARKMENLDPIEGGDVHHIQLNMQPISAVGGQNASNSSAQDSNV